MHELALMDDLVETVIDKMGARRVRVIRLVVGKQSGVLADALRFSFDVAVEGTPLAGAALEVIDTDGADLCLKEIEVDGCV
jgi:hydrogenase nickel incorporation protein HypA/HybF